MTQSMPVIIFGDKHIQYTVVRTNRSTIGIIVEPSGDVVVRAPPDIREDLIHDTVTKKRKWIANKIHHTSLVKLPIPKKQELVSGEKIRYKNKHYRLRVHTHKKKKDHLVFVGGILHIYVKETLAEEKKAAKIKYMIIAWYKARAKAILTQRVNRYSKLFEKKPTSINVRDTKIRWGSCTKEGNLLFNWRIIMAPFSAIDYVVIHELCHLTEPKHTPKFWHLLESILPSYKKWKEWLHINGRLLDLRM